MKTINLIISVVFFLLVVGCKKDDPKRTLVYPAIGFYGDNILDTLSSFVIGVEYSMAVELGEGAELKIVISDLGDYAWGLDPIAVENWAVHKYDLAYKKQIFRTINDNSKCDLRINFNTDSFRIDFYENGSEEVTFSKLFK